MKLTKIIIINKTLIKVIIIITITITIMMNIKRKFNI